MIVPLLALILAQTSIAPKMEQVMGEFPKLARPVPSVRVIEERKIQDVLYRKVQFESEPGDWVPAWILIPQKAGAGKRPAMLCLHQTTNFGKDEPAGFSGKPSLFYARELAERGFVTIVPDYPSLGENKTDPYQMGYVSTSMKGIWNHVRAVDLLVSLPEVDADRIGTIGHSLGGHNSLFVAVFDPRIKVIVSSCGFTKMSHYMKGNLKGWDGWRYMPRVGSEYENSPKKIPFDFPEILASLRDRVIFVNAPLHDDNFDVAGVRECMKKAGPCAKAVYPDAGHDFPQAIREQAYSLIEKTFHLH